MLIAKSAIKFCAKPPLKTIGFQAYGGAPAPFVDQTPYCCRVPVMAGLPVPAYMKLLKLSKIHMGNVAVGGLAQEKQTALPQLSPSAGLAPGAEANARPTPGKSPTWKNRTPFCAQVEDGPGWLQSCAAERRL